MLVRRWAEFPTAIRGASWSTDTWTGVLRHDEVRLNDSADIIGLAAVRPLNAALCGGKAAARAAPIKEACTKTWPRQGFTRLNRRISIRANNAALLAGNPREE